MCHAAILKRAEHRLTYLLSQVFKEETKRQKLCHIIGIKQWATLTQPHEEEGFPVAVVFYPTRDPAQREANNYSVLVCDIRKPHSCTRVMPQKHLTAFITILHWCLFNTTSFVQVEIWNDISGPGCLGGVVVSTVTLQQEGLWLYIPRPFRVVSQWVMGICFPIWVIWNSKLAEGLRSNGCSTLRQCDKHLFLKSHWDNLQ